VISLDLVAEIEAAAYRSWPAAEIVEYDGWQLRYADGFSRRGNSVYPLASSTVDHEQKLEWCGQWYQRHSLDLVFRQTAVTEPGLDEVLAQHGFTEEGRTNVLVAGLSDSDSSDLIIGESPSPQWWKATAALWDVGGSRADAWRAIVDRIDLPTGFGVVAQGGQAVAAGFAVVDATWLGLFEIIVADRYRRRGIGGSLTKSLMAWGRGKGAQRAYLQVVADNTAAINLYEKAGFRFAYDYWYRRAPVG
jgi:ribosomal protein S18 acetylase RimI-like enzyme